MNHWVNLFQTAKPLGFTYFNAYVDPSSGLVQGWVARVGTGKYAIYYFDSRLVTGLLQGARGSARSAMRAVDGAVARLKQGGGIGSEWLAGLTAQIVKANAVKAARGW